MRTHAFWYTVTIHIFETGDIRPNLYLAIDEFLAAKNRHWRSERGRCGMPCGASEGWAVVVQERLTVRATRASITVTDLQLICYTMFATCRINWLLSVLVSNAYLHIVSGTQNHKIMCCVVFEFVDNYGCSPLNFVIAICFVDTYITRLTTTDGWNEWTDLFANTFAPQLCRVHPVAGISWWAPKEQFFSLRAPFSQSQAITVIYVPSQ